MGADLGGKARAIGRGREDSVRTLPAQGGTPRVQEDPGGTPAIPCQGCSASHEIGLEGADGTGPDGQHALLATLAQDDDGAVLEIEVVDVQAGGLRHSHPGAVQQLHEGTVAQADRCLVIAGRTDQALDFVIRQCLGQSHRNGRWMDIGSRIDPSEPLRFGEGMEGPDRHHHSRGARRRKRGAITEGLAQAGRKVGDIVLGDVLDVGEPALITPLGISIQITSIGGDGVDRQATLDGDMGEIAGYRAGDTAQPKTSDRDTDGRSNASATA